MTTNPPVSYANSTVGGPFSVILTTSRTFVFISTTYSNSHSMKRLLLIVGILSTRCSNTLLGSAPAVQRICASAGPELSTNLRERILVNPTTHHL